MTKYTRPSKDYPKSWSRLRFVVYKRDNYICQICGVKCEIGCGWRSPNCHHRVPVKISHNHSISNLMTVCKRCHELLHEEYIREKNESL
jgi:5-methylcytosine-specific restriction endonuclease McrA